MGTRNLTCVFVDGEYKIAQYGQWDGYPAGQGTVALKFLRQANLELFAKKVKQTTWATEDEITAQWIECGLTPGDEFVSCAVADLHTARYPHCSRDAGALILQIVYESETPLALINEIDYANDSLFCEWAYVVDLDKRTFEVYEGFQRRRASKDARFYTKFPDDSGYYPVKLVVKFDLSDLPNEIEFLSHFKTE
jgi:hypothetical protein